VKICIDAGHGLGNRQKGFFDPGAVHREGGELFREADIAFVYAQLLGSTLIGLGVEVFFTRSTNLEAAPVGLRAKRATEAGCTHLISLHLNDFDDDSANGLEVLYGSQGSQQLARHMQRELAGITGMRDRGFKPRYDLAVLKFPGKAILIELGFIANDSDRTKLLDPTMRQRIVSTIAEVLLANP